MLAPPIRAHLVQGQRERHFAITDRRAARRRVQHGQVDRRVDHLDFDLQIGVVEALLIFLGRRGREPARVMLVLFEDPVDAVLGAVCSDEWRTEAAAAAQ